MKFLVTGFLGAIRQRQGKLIPDTVGVDSRNQNPVRGDLRAWRQPLTVASVPAGRKTIYRMGRDVVSDALYWLSWTTVVHAVRGFIANDTSERTYFTGSGTPKVTDNTIGLASSPYPSAARELGVPKPTTPMTLTQTAAGTGDDELRFYTQTFLTDRGEESAPGPVASITVKPGALIDLTALEAAPTGNFGITLRRIYRTQATTSGSAEYFFLREIAVSLTSSEDDARELNLAAVLVTNGPVGAVGRDWLPPPADLKHLTAMHNGMLAGISGRSVRYCEPFKPYAWPPAYETLPPDVTPVALAAFASSLLVLTTGRPYLVTGGVPESLGDEPVQEMEQACISETSVVPIAGGAVWAAPDGLAYFGSNGKKLLTSGILAREDWLAMNPSTIVACQYEGAYMGFYDSGGGVIKGFLIDPTNPTGLYYLSAGYAAAFFDRLRDALYVLEADGTIKKWDAGTAFMTATFVSKVFRSERPFNPAVLRVIADVYPVTVKLTSDQVHRVTGATTMVLRETRTVANANPVTLKGGYLSSEFQVEVSVTGAGGVQGIIVADSVQEAMQ
jgi:hypothetical protein